MSSYRSYFLVISLISSLVATSCREMVLRGKYENTLLSMKEIDAALSGQGGRSYPAGETLDVVLRTNPSLPNNDAWGRPFRYFSDGKEYWLASAGSDNNWELADLRAYRADEHKGYESDAVVHNGIVIHGRYLAVELQDFSMRD